MGLNDVIRIVRQRWLLVVAMILICGAASAFYASTVPLTYTATTRLYVSMATGTSVNDSYQGGLAAQQRVTSYSYLPEGITVAERVVKDVGLTTTPAELRSRIKVSFPPATTLLDISVTDSTPDGARLLADKVAAQFRRLVSEIETTVVSAAPAAQATVIDPAQTPTEPNGPNIPRLIAIGLAVGLVLGILAAVVRDRFDRRVRRSDQLTQDLSVPVIEFVPGRGPEAARAITRVRARLASARGGPGPATVLLTSFSARSVPGVAVKLSTALVASGHRVALIDADTSRQGVSARLGLHTHPGLAEWLRTPRPSVDDALVVRGDGVGVLPLGQVDERTCDLLASDRFAELVSGLKARFDYILVDAAPVPLDAAPLALSAWCDHTLALVELGEASLADVHAAANSFRESGSGLVGVVTVSAPSRQEPRTPPTSPNSSPSLVPST